MTTELKKQTPRLTRGVATYAPDQQRSSYGFRSCKVRKGITLQRQILSQTPVNSAQIQGAQRGVKLCKEGCFFQRGSYVRVLPSVAFEM